MRKFRASTFVIFPTERVFLRSSVVTRYKHYPSVPGSASIFAIPERQAKILLTAQDSISLPGQLQMTIGSWRPAGIASDALGFQSRAKAAPQCEDADCPSHQEAPDPAAGIEIIVRSR